MTIEEARSALDNCTRNESKDHAFGDREVYWNDSTGKEVAFGYFSGTDAMVSFNGYPIDSTGYSFEGAEARELVKHGTPGAISRNDSTGPDEYTEGEVMPGLTLAAVRRELEGK